MKEKILKRIQHILELINKHYQSEIQKKGNLMGTVITTTQYEVEFYKEAITQCQSLIANVYGEDSQMFERFGKEKFVQGDLDGIKGYLNTLKYEVENDWLTSIKGLITAEVFTDFFEMAEHFLENNYKDAAAIIVGTTLENHLKQLSVVHNNPVTTDTGKSKAASLLNDDLTKLGVYNKIDNKTVVAWLGIRNDAAHGNFNQYDKKQVESMLNDVRYFIARNPL